MVIGFSGRMRSGKTELSKICEQHGFKILYFALPLKQLCADIMGMTIEELNNAKNANTPINITLNEEICEYLSQETDISLSDTREVCLLKTIHSVRELLQFIGTDYIREYNTDWHVNKIKEMINPNENYAIDDVRFLNEKRMIEELGGDCWFVTRTTLDNISNHISETSIKWGDCWNKIIINNSTLQELQFKWDIFIDNYTTSCEIREKKFNEILKKGIKTFTNEVSVLDVLLLPKELFTYIPKDFNEDSITNIKMNDDKCVLITYNDGSIEFIDNPLNIEDLKIHVKQNRF